MPRTLPNTITEAPAVPPPNSLTKLVWTEKRAREAPYVTWRNNVPYIGERRLVLHRDDAEKLITELYKEPGVPPNIGWTKFHYMVTAKYIGIRRAWVREFLQRQDGWQIHQKPHRVAAVKVITARGPLVRWQADVVAMPSRNNSRFRGLWCVKDIMSKLIFAYPIKNESVESSKACFERFLTDLQTLNPNKDEDVTKKIRVLQTDGGPSSGREFREWLQEKHDIKLILGRAWHPQSQGSIERAQATISSMVQAYAETRYGDKYKWARAVPLVTSMLRTTWSRVIDTTPIHAAFGTTDEQDDARRRVLKEAESRTNRAIYTTRVLHPGDHVRISLRAGPEGSAQVKAAIKQHTYKAREVQWGDTVYTIKKKSGNSYGLVEIPGKLYDRSDLLWVPDKSPQPWSDHEMGADDNNADIEDNPPPLGRRVIKPRVRLVETM